MSQDMACYACRNRGVLVWQERVCLVRMTGEDCWLNEKRCVLCW